MSNQIGSILRAATRKAGEPLRILTFPTHERYQSGLAKCNAVFYMFRSKNVKDWNSTYAPLPSNHILLNPARNDNQLPPEIDFDLVLSQSKFGQFQIAKQVARQLHLPLVSLEHTLPGSDWSVSQIESLRAVRGDINVFISDFSRKAWRWDDGEVIHHGVDSEVFSPAPVNKKAHALSVVNDWVNRDWCCGFSFWRQATDGIPVFAVGDTPGLSKPASSVVDLVNRYREAEVFVNTSLVSPVPTALLEAMSCGCAVVSTATCMIPEVIEHGVNGLLAKDPAEMRSHLQLLLGDASLRKTLGENARQTVLERFSMGKFVSAWDGVFHRAAKIVFKG